MQLIPVLLTSIMEVKQARRTWTELSGKLAGYSDTGQPGNAFVSVHLCMVSGVIRM